MRGIINCSILITLMLFCGTLDAQELGGLSLQYEKSISLPSISGRLEHLGIDRKTNRLFLAAYSNNLVAVIDPVQGTIVQTVPNFVPPLDVMYVPDTDKLYVSSDDGALRILDGKTFAELSSFDLTLNADALRYDQVNKRVYAGYSTGNIAVIDGLSDRLLTTISFTGHPSGFEVDRTGGKLFINTPSGNRIVMVDLTTFAPVGSIVLPAQQNYAMSLDEIGRRLFVACRNPGQLLILNCDTSNVIAAVPIHNGANDLFYDEANRRLYVACGEGFIDIIRQATRDHYFLSGSVPTAAGAATALFLPEQHTFYLVVPDDVVPISEIRVYTVLP